MVRQNKKKPSKQPIKHKIMVDASALMALSDRHDQFHNEAIKFRNSFILNYAIELYTTNYIYSEAMSHLTHLDVTMLKNLHKIISSPPPDDPLGIRQLWVYEKTVQEAVPIYFDYLEHDFSITDCTTFILMQKNDILAAFSFDEDYKIYTYLKGHEKRKFWKLPEMLDEYLMRSIKFI
jgi:uncharacterized protein